jgi:hypothetical protein
VTTLENPVKRKTRGALDGSYGVDSGRPLVAEFSPGDLLVMRPHGTRRPVKISLFDVYRFAVRCRAAAIERRIKDLRKAGIGRADARRQAEREVAA